MSSPIYKLVKLAEAMEELMGLLSRTGEVPESDAVFNMTIFLIVKLGLTEGKATGARFIEECSYIDTFMHDDQIGMIQ